MYQIYQLIQQINSIFQSFYVAQILLIKLVHTTYSICYETWLNFLIEIYAVHFLNLT